MEEIIKFSGTNEKLFTRDIVENVTEKTTLIVPETHSAIIISDGEMLQTLPKGRYLLRNLVEVKKNEKLSLEIIFVSKTAKLKLLWGTPNKITIEDPVLNLPYKMGMSGDFEVQVSDPRKCFLYLVGAEDVLTSDALQDRLMSKVVSVVETELARFIAEKKVLYSNVYQYKQEIARRIVPILSNSFSSSYGITVYSLNIANIIFDEDDLDKLNKKNNVTVKKALCPVCNTELEPNAKFCFNCGAKISNKKTCPKCGAENSGEARFCSMCGERF